MASALPNVRTPSELTRMNPTAIAINRLSSDIGKHVDAARAKLVPEAHLAAIAIEHGLVLCSTDGDFARFPRLRWENPLRGA